MSGARGYIVIAVLVGLVVFGLRALMRVDHSERNLEIFTEMVYSKAGESNSSSAALPGGLTQQPLVAGVIPRGLMPLRFGTSPEEAQRMGRELTSPFSAGDTARLDRGRELYGVYCSVCHDPAGDGQGSVTQRGMLPPPSMHAARALQLSDGELFHILTFGQGNMASYAAQLTREERWEVILHLRALQEQKKR